MAGAASDDRAKCVPAVATGLGDNREVIISRRTSYLVPASSAEALADAMLGIQSDVAALKHMGYALAPTDGRPVQPRLHGRAVRAFVQRVSPAEEKSRLTSDGYGAGR